MSDSEYFIDLARKSANKFDHSPFWFVLASAGIYALLAIAAAIRELKED